MIIKIKGKPSIRFETTATSFKEIEKPDNHPAVFTKTEIKQIFDLLKTKTEISISAKCLGVGSLGAPCIYKHHYDVEKTDKGNLQIGCSVMAKKDVQRLRKWANRK